ncbi:MAG TPA: T9SS type A sorting domain-containing protein, partial [Balneolales bacterium]|nr:T9SS type A sorting domain-containing protein [Balneolales bacterium]
MEINGGSDVSMIDGVNEIEDNPNYQILVDPSSTLTMGDASTPQEGDNSVFAASGNSNYLVYNESSTSVDAYGNWWGTSSPSSSLFYGPIDYSGWLSYDPCAIIGCGVPSGGYPQHMAPSSPEPMLVRGVSKETSPEVQMNTSPSKTSSVSLASSKAELRARMHTLWGKIAQASDGQGLMKEIQELYMLHLVSYRDSSFSSERKQDRTLWDGMIRNYLNGSPITGANEITLSATQAERLMLMDEHEAYRFGRYAEAQKKVTEYAPYISSARGKIAHMTDQMNLLDARGSYKQELALLDKVEQAEVSLGEPAKQVVARYQIAQENIQEALNLKMAGSNGAVGNLSDSVASVRPTRTALNANYPNPFNPTTIISYQLAQSGHIRLTVWNILGRRVATLVDANQQKGIHEVTFNASQLSSGVYFYRLQAGSKVLVKKMLLMK